MTKFGIFGENHLVNSVWSSNIDDCCCSDNGGGAVRFGAGQCQSGEVLTLDGGGGKISGG